MVTGTLSSRKKLQEKKGFATIAYADGTLVEAESHWYEAQGVGRREMKIKQEVDQ